MRFATLLLFLIVSNHNTFTRSQQQPTNLEESHDSRPLDGSKSKAKPVGQREYYIPSYSSPQLLERPQEFVYPNNIRNSFQYPKTTNKAPDLLNQRQWSSGQRLGNAIHRNFRYRNPEIFETSVDSNSNELNRDSNNDFPYQRSQTFTNNYQNLNQNNYNKIQDHISAQKSKQIALNNKLREFDDEEQRLTKAKAKSTGHDTKDDSKDNKDDNKLNELLMGPIMRRKSALNVNSMHSSSLQRSGQTSIPVPQARHQSPESEQSNSFGDFYFVAIVACVSAVAIFATIGAGICVYKVQQSNKAAADVDYPAYGVVGPASKETNSTGNLSPSGDRKLAQSAQMYHYHHQKQQMIASEKAVTNRRNSASDVESDEENEEGEYTVYECPGLAPTGEMEVKNPLFHDDITPVSSPSVRDGNNGNNSKDK